MKMQQRIDWSNPANGQRLLAAILAAQGMKLDYKTIAIKFGRGATYDAIEGHFRKIKRLAASLPDEHCDSTTPPPPTPSATRTRRKPKAATTPLEDIAPRKKTLAGRITKSRTRKSPGRAKKGTVPDGADREGGKVLDEGVHSASSSMDAQGVVENSFEALMGGWHLGGNGGVGDIFMGLPELGSDMGVDGPGG